MTLCKALLRQWHRRGANTDTACEYTSYQQLVETTTAKMSCVENTATLRSSQTTFRK